MLNPTLQNKNEPFVSEEFSIQNLLQFLQTLSRIVRKLNLSEIAQQFFEIFDTGLFQNLKIRGHET